jgi:hypothetical protein
MLQARGRAEAAGGCGPVSVASDADALAEITTAGEVPLRW